MNAGVRAPSSVNLLASSLAKSLGYFSFFHLHIYSTKYLCVYVCLLYVIPLQAVNSFSVIKLLPLSRVHSGDIELEMLLSLLPSFYGVIIKKMASSDSAEEVNGLMLRVTSAACITELETLSW